MISTNEYVKRYYNTIIHCLTLHLTNVFFHIVKKFLIDSNITKIGITQIEINNFRDRLFTYDPTFEQMNLAQTIVINLYKAEFNDIIKPNKSIGSLKDILKKFVNPKLYKVETATGTNLGSLDNIIVERRMDEFNEYMDNIYDYMNIYFDLINKKIPLFLTNYVKFLELQYNLLKIKTLVA
jgi:hypothetical protein